MAHRRASAKKKGGSLAFLLGLCVLVIVAALSPAYTSSATQVRGGQGQATISGYAISDIHWQLGVGGSLQGVSLHLSPAGARSVQVRVASSGAWFACSVLNGTASCALPAGMSVARADELSVIAS